MRALFLGVMSVVLTASTMLAADSAPAHQFMEFRHYKFVSPEAAKSFDDHVSTALIPALNRAGVKPVGYWKTTDEATAGERYMLVTYGSLADIGKVRAAVTADEDYQAKFREYAGRDAKIVGLDRVRSELLESFDCWPKTTVPELTKAGKQALFELRTYESPTEHLGNEKVVMFNSGEVPIFLDCQISPVFMGQALVGDRLPNLTYMTVYPDAATRDAAWVKFREHPDWKEVVG